MAKEPCMNKTDGQMNSGRTALGAKKNLANRLPFQFKTPTCTLTNGIMI